MTGSNHIWSESAGSRKNIFVVVKIDASRWDDICVLVGVVRE